MGDHTIYPIDLHFLGLEGTIAAYLIRHDHGAVLIESGPASTLPALQAGLQAHGLTLADISDVLLTHIHLDHGGAAGHLARQGARIHVHPVGAPHLLQPDKLLASAARLYGTLMHSLWGEVLPVPPESLCVPQDGDEIEINGLRFVALDTPGHADHHYAYLFQDLCFSGDIGGVRLSGLRHLRLPMPPPEFHLEKWRHSLGKLAQAGIRCIAPTHFGIYADADWHLAALEKALDEVEAWMEAHLHGDPPLETLTAEFTQWSRQRSLAEGVPEDKIEYFEAANPSWMSPPGMLRYWRKYRQNG
jgi:glyoxylase-like metal-dependent hydrolase (beta-lactamase superfamily II)